MFNNLLIALVQDVLRFLKEHEKFFELAESTRAEYIHNCKYFPHAIKDYLKELTEKHLYSDISEIIEYVSSETQKPAIKGGLVKAFAEFCIEVIPSDLDEKHFTNDFTGAFGKHLEIFYGSAVEKHILATVQEFISHIYKSSFIVIQSPLLLKTEQKQEMRKQLREKYKTSIPTFSVNKNLIGGLRVFIDGTTHDHSWISQINKITSLTNIK